MKKISGVDKSHSPEMKCTYMVKDSHCVYSSCVFTVPEKIKCMFTLVFKRNSE